MTGEVTLSDCRIVCSGGFSAPSGSGSKNGIRGRPLRHSLCLYHRSLAASGPAKFMGQVASCAMDDQPAHRIWGACG
jgi:hypothetical protein